jgi:hypothetical protein
MSRQLDPMFDDRIADWLEDDPTTAPSQLLETVVAAVPSIPQRAARARWLPTWRSWIVWFAFAPVLAVALGLIWLLLPRAPSIGPPPSPTPVATPAFGLSGATTRFTSPRFGYSMDVPAEWTVRVATESLVELGAPWIDSAAVDYVAATPVAALTPGIIVSAVELSEGQTLDGWTDLTTVATCGVPATRTATEVDGAPGVELEYPSCFGLHHIWVTIVRGTTGFHIVWIGSRGTEADDRALFERVLASITLPPAAEVSPAPS